MAHKFSNYEAYPQVRKNTRATIIENEPQVAVRDIPRRVMLKTSSPVLRNVPSPRAREFANSATPSSDATSVVSSMWSKRSSAVTDYEEDLYNVTDDETEEVPLICSNSVKRTVAKSIPRYPSLSIPSPSTWPMPPNLHKPSTCNVGLSPAAKVAISPARLSALSARNLFVPASSATPSLDGSLTSEELAISSCPSTPDLQERVENEGEWEPPVQLDPYAFETLHQIDPDTDRDDIGRTVIEVSQQALSEMQEIIRDTPIRRDFLPANNIAPTPGSYEANEPLSALSVPSPGGFFGSLQASTRSTWWTNSPVLPSTSTAENFYGVPWREPGRTPTSRATRSVSPPAIDSAVSSPTTVPTITSPTEIIEVHEIISTPESNAPYQEELKRTSMVNVDRTKLWLHSQLTYLSSIVEESNAPASAVPTTPDADSSPISSNGSPSKRSVRFLDAIDEQVEPTSKAPLPDDNPIFFQGFKHINETSNSKDAFLHRQARAEACHVESNSLPRKASQQLQGYFEVKDVHRPIPVRPISTFLPEAPIDDLKEIIASAERERQALEQMAASAWELQAATHIFGTQLINSPAITHIRSSPDARILDFGGQVACDWGWQVALKYKTANIITIPCNTDDTLPQIRGPSNHHIVHPTSLSSLPFPSAHFDLISARTLHTMLKSHPTTTGLDEYDTILSEFQRILKPGGYLEFNLLDAELLHPGPFGQTLSVEFAFNLKTRGYDANATRSFLPKLRKAGFAGSGVKRCWMVLPVADVTPKWVDNGKVPLLATPGIALTSSSSGGNSSSGSNVTPRASEMTAAGKTSYFPIQKKGTGVNGPVTGTGVVYEPPVTGSTGDVRAMTGLVGARGWMRWHLKLQREMAGGNGFNGVAEEKVMERVCRALEEGGKGKAGWRCLIGFARKDM